MDQSAFDAKGFIEFDLSSGTICSSGKEQLALVPLDVLAELDPKKETLMQAVRSWGRIHGELLKGHLLDQTQPAGMETLADHLGGTAAALGMGRLSMEIFGDALLFRSRLQDISDAKEGQNALIGGFLAGYLDGFTGHPFDVAPLGSDDGDLVFFAGNSSAVNRVRLWREQGLSLRASIARLSGGSD